MRLDWSMSNMLKEERNLGEAKSMVWLLLLRSVAKRVGHAEEKEKKEAKAIRPSVWELKQKQKAKAQRVSAIFVWVPEWASNTKERASTERCSPKNREKHSECERVKKKKETFFSLLKIHTGKINWWSSHGVFGCYNHRELEYSEEDFTTGFVVRFYLLLEIYLLYIQFIVDSSLA